MIASLPAAGRVEVLRCETRPLLQGARLTAGARASGIPHALLVDGAAAGLIRRGRGRRRLVGCDRVAANGDVANKVGTYAHALAARGGGDPVRRRRARPSSTRSGDPTGDEVAIEERDPDEVRRAAGALVTVEDTECRNPAFDVTPFGLVSALVTERGVAQPVSSATVAALLAR